MPTSPPTDLEPPRYLDIEYVPSPAIVVTKMIEVANLSERDVVFDLGCGDGRLLIEAARDYGVCGVGFDLDPARVAEARANVEAADLGDLIWIEHGCFFEADLRPATVVMLYLSPKLNVRLLPQLDQLAPGSRVISHDFAIEGVEYDDVWLIEAEHHRAWPRKRTHNVLKWTTPLDRGLRER